MTRPNNDNDSTQDKQVKELKRSISDNFAELKDPRRETSVTHQLMDILFISICAITSGSNDLKAVAEYAKSKREWLTKVLDLRHGVPSYNVLWLLFRLIKPDSLNECFGKWMKSTALSKAKAIAIDGKAQRGTATDGEPNSFIHIVSAWAVQNQLTLAQLKVDSKSNEITAIPKLLELIDISDCVVTIDAMGAQTDIADLIISGGGDYVFSLKGNQGKLHAEIINYFDQALVYGEDGSEFTSSYTQEVGHGRYEKREIFVTDKIDFLSQKSRWKGIKMIACIHSTRINKGKQTVEKRYYITSLTATAEELARHIRGHWGIENQAHWVLDVAYREDRQRAKAGHIAENLSVMRRISLNYIKQDTTVKAGVEIKRQKAGWDTAYLLHLLGIKSFS